MTAITNLVSAPHPSDHLRQFDPGRDLARVADLVEMCFADSLDQDGRNYLRRMRLAAQRGGYLGLPRPLISRSGLPLSGFVWEEAGRLVGNLTLIPFTGRGFRYYLIANVAVHPDYRRRGIARGMTTAAIEYIRLRGAHAAWLHVRQENQPAQVLYSSQGFVERTRRTSWVYDFTSTLTPANRPDPFGLPGSRFQVRVSQRTNRDWLTQKNWLDRLYPDAFAWHFSLKKESLRPGLWGFIYRMANDLRILHWAVRADNRLLAVLTWQASLGYTDHLWLAASDEAEGGAIQPLLEQACRQLAHNRPLSLEYPAGRAATAIQAAGFHEHQTLVWMERKFI